MHGLILGCFCLGFGLVLAVTDRLTSKDMAARALEDRQNSLSQVIPATIHDNDPVEDSVVLKDAGNREIKSGLEFFAANKTALMAVK